MECRGEQERERARSQRARAAERDAANASAERGRTAPDVEVHKNSHPDSKCDDHEPYEQLTGLRSARVRTGSEHAEEAKGEDELQRGMDLDLRH